MTPVPLFRRAHAWMVAAVLLAVLAYSPGLGGGWFFDDFPNIVDNPDVQPTRLDLATLANAALSSPASDIGRPLASLSFVANHALGGLDPFGWKLANLAIHLANGWLVFLLTLALCEAAVRRGRPVARASATAVLVACAWLLLPINLTTVLYVVQRMESLANLFVLLGLLGYVRARLRMQLAATGAFAAIASVAVATALGVLAKESAILLPLF